MCVCACPWPSGLVLWLSVSIWRGTNWWGDSTSSCFVRTWRPRCWIDKTWSSKFCHMSSHVFPCTSWEHSALRLSNSLTVTWTAQHSSLRPRLQWVWAGEMLPASLTLSDLSHPVASHGTNTVTVDGLIPLMLKIYVKSMYFGWKSSIKQHLYCGG